MRSHRLAILCGMKENGFLSGPPKGPSAFYESEAIYPYSVGNGYGEVGPSHPAVRHFGNELFFF